MKKKKVLPIIIGVIVIAAVLSNMKGKPKTGDAAVRSDTSMSETKPRKIKTKRRRLPRSKQTQLKK